MITPPPPEPSHDRIHPQMSLDSSLMPRGVEDIPEKDLRELAKWFKSRSSERRRLLKRYKTGRQKTEALAARKQVGFTYLWCLCCFRVVVDVVVVDGPLFVVASRGTLQHCSSSS